MRSLILHGFLVSVFCVLSGSAHAIYRCEASGKVSYSDVPCTGATQIDIKTFDADSATTAQKRLAKDKEFVDRIEKTRRHEEAAAEKARQRAARKRVVQDKKCASLSRRQEKANDDVRVAPNKSVEKARRKASRIAEQYESECKGHKTHLLAA